MKKDRTELEQTLSEVIISKKLKTKKRHVKDIKTYLYSNYDIFEGDIQSWIDDPVSTLSELDMRILFLLSEQVQQKVGGIDVNDYFTESQIRESKKFSGMLEIKQNNFDFPITISNATVVGNSAYMVTMDIKTIDKLLDNQLLNYNFELQREASFVRRKEKVIIEPTLNMGNVKEISEHLLEGTLVPTVLVFNAATRSAKSGSELEFDAKRLELTINEGTVLDIVDGYHRCRASQNALQRNPELNFNFAVLITNYSTKKAQQYQAQLAKATPISRTRIQELEANRLSDTVVQQLKDESDLKGKISQTSHIHSLNKELVTYNVLSNTIDEQFKMETRADAADVGDYLVEFFNMLIGIYPEEFIYNIEETRKVSLINDNNIIGIGFITLARRMFDNNIKAKEVRKIIKDIDFSRTNAEWEQLGILNNQGNLNETTKIRKVIKDYFENININNNVKN